MGTSLIISTIFSTSFSIVLVDGVAPNFSTVKPVLIRLRENSSIFEMLLMRQ
jgi:hypothetical protein